MTPELRQYRTADMMDYAKRIRYLEAAEAVLRRAEAAVIAAAVVFSGSCIYDIAAQTEAGLPDEGFPGFEELLAVNPDTAAWIRMDGTHIDHPVVRGEDNFEYIDKDFDGSYYQGGCIFLDSGNSPDMTDDYIIIHGHHMSGGAMFGDAAAYTDRDFFMEHDKGELITMHGLYELTVAAAGIFNAYEGELYHTGKDAGRPLHLMDECECRRDAVFRDGDKLVALSTCSGDMTNDRAVVFCRARYMEGCDVRSEKK